jgi:UDP-glucose 4-epimerase
MILKVEGCKDRQGKNALNHKDAESKRILVTGSGGFIGSHLKRALPNADGLGLTESSTTNICGDILSPPISVNDYEIIYHLAGVVGPEAGMLQPLRTYKINVCGTLNLLESFEGLFVFLSTVGVHEPLRGPYFLSKYVCEEIVKSAPCKYIIFRLANPYGKASKSVVQKWLEADKIQIYGDGNQSRDFVYIDDIIEILANPFKLKLNKTYNVGTGVATTMNELAKLIEEVAGKRTIEHLPAREFDIYEPVIKPDIVCKTSLKEGLLRSLAKGVT